MLNGRLKLLPTRIRSQKLGLKIEKCIRFNNSIVPNLNKRFSNTWNWLHIIIPVSYTHLDVYKRQSRGRRLMLY